MVRGSRRFRGAAWIRSDRYRRHYLFRHLRRSEHGSPGYNNSATVTGYYSDSNFHAYCFIRESDGDIASFDVLSSGSADCEGINDRGDIPGDFVDGNTVHGFVRHANGSVDVFDGQNGSQLIEPADINERGEVTGFFTDANGWHGFVRQTDGTITSFDASPGSSTSPLAINRRGTILGATNGRGNPAFIRKSNGHVVLISRKKVEVVTPGGINRDGDVTGSMYYPDKPSLRSMASHISTAASGPPKRFTS